MSNIDTKISGLTRQREVVLQVICESDEHLAANEIFDNAKRLLPTMSSATVFDSLRFLKDAGHIAEISFGSGASRFDRKLTRHDHAICNKCGKLVDLEFDFSSELLHTAATVSKFTPEILEFTLRGLCPECKS